MLQYISSSLIVWPYQYIFLHKNCIVTAYLNPSDKINKIVKYKVKHKKDSKSKTTNYKKITELKSVSKIEFLKTYPPILSSVPDFYICP